MFGLGWVEIVVVLALGYLALRAYLRRRFPRRHRTFDFVFYTTVALMLLFSMLTYYRQG